MDLPACDDKAGKRLGSEAFLRRAKRAFIAIVSAVLLFYSLLCLLLSHKKIFIIPSKPGQLGNSLWLFAQLISVARENNVAVVDPAFAEYADYFERTANSLVSCYPDTKVVPFPNEALRSFLQQMIDRVSLQLNGRIWRKYCYTVSIPWRTAGIVDGRQLELHCSFDLNSISFRNAIAKKKIIFLRGFYFTGNMGKAACDNEIKEYFTPLSAFRQNIGALMGRIRERTDVVIGIHMRVGDYDTFQEGKYFYTIDHYVSFMRASEGLFPGKQVGFLICSNMQIPEDTFDGFNYCVGTGHMIEDLYALANCDYILGPPSTFSGWASYYGGVPLCIITEAQQEISIRDFSVFSSQKIIAEKIGVGGRVIDITEECLE